MKWFKYSGKDTTSAEIWLYHVETHWPWMPRWLSLFLFVYMGCDAEE